MSKFLIGICVCGAASMLAGFGILIHAAIWIGPRYGWLDDRVFSAEFRAFSLTAGGYALGMAGALIGKYRASQKLGAMKAAQRRQGAK